MAFLDDQSTDNSPTPQNNPKPFKNMGAIAPTLSELIRKKDPPKAEPYRPASADRLALRPNRFILNRIKHYCVDQDISITHFFEIAALEYLKNRDPEYGRPDAKAPQIDRLINRNSLKPSSIREIFQFWTKAFNDLSQHHSGPWRPTWTDRDATLEKQFEDIDPRVIEIAIMTAISRKQKGERRILSLNYFADEIRTQATEWSSTNPKLIDTRLQSARALLSAALGVTYPER